ncbi:folylpolyglutamate synthase, mitochondrial-like isoform X2 [Centruroides vittatus]|uniref:folylpolyglutamate synthase, mitochondrial-like isoform X2 n=1 Tax=Centruroides vittatus TaxID=120091 RepID=UPI00350EC3DD
MRIFWKIVKQAMELGTSADKRSFSTVTKLTYEDAVYALNGLQSNAAVLEKARKERSVNAYKNLKNTEKFLKKLDITPTDLDRLNIIHISGTKGKGSTCAFTESVLRRRGVKTGFYSSPHLVAVRERIRINGKPLCKEMFTSYFWKVYNKLKLQEKAEEVSMPPYFMFLTIMAFYVFLQEKVEVAIIEVGVGGLYDNTNIVRSPVATGVTSLGYDHVAVLGKTIEEIAWQKAGIFKTGVPAFTVSQPQEAMKVLQKKASEINCSLHVVPPLSTYEWEKVMKLGIPGDVQTMNASLALQLCQSWINQKKQGLQNCRWPGRHQTIHRDSITYFLDGAHTAESMIPCVRWYTECIKKIESNIGDIYKVLLFNCTGERKAETLLTPLIDIPFDLVVFSPNKLDLTKDATSDQSNFTVDPDKELIQCERNMKVWNYLLSSVYEEEISSNAAGTLSKSLLSHSSEQNNNNTVVFSCLKDALQFICRNHDSDLRKKVPIPNSSFPLNSITAKHLSLFVTGSIHLVGNVLSLIDPELQEH